jgi:flagellar basal body rod protein FlgG
MNVGIYSGAAGMRAGQDYQSLVSQNLAMESVPGYKQTIPVFTTDAQLSSAGSATASGNPAAVHMTQMTDFSQGPIQPSASPYHMAVEGKAFFEVRESNGTTSYTRNGSFAVSPTGELQTSDGAPVLGSGGSAITIDPATAAEATIGADGTISINGASAGRVDLAHFDNPTTTLSPIAHGRYAAPEGVAQEGPAAGDQVLGNSLEGSNGNAVSQMADMIQAVRLYEANSKAVTAADDNTNQLITTMGGHAS